MTAPHDLVKRTRAYLGRVKSAPLKRLFKLLGVEAESLKADALAVTTAASTAEGAERVLAALSSQARTMLGCWVLRGESGVADRWTGTQSSFPDAVLGADREAAERELRDHGLLLSPDFRPELLPALVPSLWPLAAEWTLRILHSAAGERPPAPLLSALALAVYAAERPLVAKSGELHVRSRERIVRRLGEHGLFGTNFEFYGEHLLRLGALRETEQGKSPCLTVDFPAAERLFSLEPEAFGLVALMQPRLRAVHLRTLAQVRAACARLGKAQPPGATVEEVVREPISMPGNLRDAVGRRLPDPYDTSQALLLQCAFGVLQATREGGVTRVRPIPPAPPAPGRWIVQPSMDVLVPWDASPRLVALLGCFADLQHLDRVSRFRLGPESVARGVECMPEPRRMLALLEEGSGVPLPGNVRANLEGWLERARPLRSLRGDVVWVESDEQRALLARHAPEASEVRPGLFLLPVGRLDALLSQARKAGFAVAPTEGRPPSGRLETPGADAREVARRALNDVEAAQAQAAKSPFLDVHAVRSSESSGRPGLGALWPIDVHAGMLGLNPAEVEEILDAVAHGGEEEEDWDEDEAEDDLAEGRDSAAAKLGRASAKGPDTVRGAAAVRGSPSGAAAPAAPKAPAAPATASRASSSNEALGTAAGAWQSPLPGVLRGILRSAIGSGRTLDLMFRNSKDKIVQRRVSPKAITAGPHGDYLVGVDAERHCDCSLALERITALRLA